MKKIFLSLLVAAAFVCNINNVQGQQHINVINPVMFNSSYPANYVNDTGVAVNQFLNGVYYFSASTDRNHYKSLWRSDGTAAGTYMVTNKITGINTIKAIGNWLYISANNAVWLTDGTDAGTNLLSAGINYLGTDFMYLNGYVYFGALLRAPVGSSVAEPVKAMNAFSSVIHFTPVNNVIFFINIDGGLYISDGTAAGTIGLGIPGASYNLTALQDSVYFINSKSLYTNPLSGDANASVPVANPLNVLVTPGYLNKPIPVIGKTFYFPGTNAATGTELYKYNSSSPGDGITLVKDIVAGPGSAGIDFNNMLVVNNTLFFTATSNNGHKELWKTDGTEAGTTIVSDFDGNVTSIAELTNDNGIIYFSCNNSILGNELWKSDGTGAGTTLVKDINAGIYNSNPAFIVPAPNGPVFFSADDGAHGVEFWKTDGTELGTLMVKDINIQESFGQHKITQLAKLNGKALFVATDDIYGREPWITDGTQAGTLLLKDIMPGITSSNPGKISIVNNTAYFFIDSASSGYHQLWKTDGTNAGTLLVKRFSDTAIQPVDIADSSNTFVYFSIKNNGQRQLWRSDGTGAGTLFICNLSQPILSQLSIGNTLYFATGNALWKTEGTPASTDSLTGIYTSYPVALKSLGDKLVVISQNKASLYNTGGLINTVSWEGDYLSSSVVKNDKLLFTAGKDIYVSGDNGPEYDHSVYACFSLDTLGNIDTVYNFNTDFASLLTLQGGKVFFVNFKNEKLGMIDDSTKTVNYISKQYYVFNMIGVSGKVFFISPFKLYGLSDGEYYTVGYSDGTYAGTQITGDSIRWYGNAYSNLTVVNNHVMFSGDDIFETNPVIKKYSSKIYSLLIEDPVLPVTLSSFTAKLQNGNGLLNWSTATEQNSDYFSIQRSTDGLHFSSIGKVAATGNSSYKQEYNYTDYKLSQYGVDKLYYRLQQFDKDGKFAYSKIVPLNINTSFTASISPIPVANQLNISITSAKRQTVLIQVVDMAGKTIASFSKTAEAGSTALSYNAAGWAKGIYQVHITQANGNKQTISVVR